MEVVKVTFIQDKRYCAVFLEDGSRFRLDLEGVLRAGLRPGKDVSPDEMAEMEARWEERKVRERALRLISYRSHSRRELVEKLKRQTDSQTAELVADQLEESGLIDDGAYARELVQALVQGRGYGRRRVELELKRRGIRGEALEEALAELTEESAEEIVEMLYYRYPQGRGLSGEKEIQRAANRLIRLGYGYGPVQAALERYLEELEEDGREL